MKANELRIGNLIYWNHKGKPNEYLCTHIVKSIDEFEIWTQSGFVKIDKINPISLTEEWLLKFGFVEEDKNIFTLRQHPIVFNIHRNLITGEFMVRVVKDYSFLIENVHHLQNLYFEISKQELECNYETES